MLTSTNKAYERGSQNVNIILIYLENVVCITGKFPRIYSTNLPSFVQFQFHCLLSSHNTVIRSTWLLQLQNASKKNKDLWSGFCVVRWCEN